MVKVALIMLLGLLPEAKPTYTDVYNFPMMGTLMYETPDPDGRRGDITAYGSATILHAQLAMCAAENLFQYDPSEPYEKSEFVTNKGGMYVFLGSDLLHPPHWYEKDKVATAKVAKYIIGKSSDFAINVNETVFQNLNTYVKQFERLPTSLEHQTSFILRDITKFFQTSEGYKFNPFHELQWDVVILVLDTKLKWTSYILPIPTFFWTSDHLVRDYDDTWTAIENVERKPHDFPPCSVPGWSPMGNNEIVYHRVVYVRFKECAEAICGAYPSTCLRYLNVRQHVCFKSLSFADSCYLDQGAPVLCNWFPGKVVGVLVKTFECGSETLPSVVTRLSAVKAFAAVARLSSSYAQEEPALDDPKYTVNPNV